MVGLAALLGACTDSSLRRTDLSGMYRSAYRYIQASQGLKSYCKEFLSLADARCAVAVADTSVFMEYAVYASKIAETTEGRDRLATIESITRRDRDRAQTFESIPVGRILDLGKSQADTPLGLFFSNPLDNVLMARVLGNFAVGKSYRELTQFNTGVTYLFFFDDKGRITQVVEGVTHYD
jgi:hypothetical protein